MKNINKQIIYITVFLTGAAVLVIEVTATRILAPYFGNTIYTISSILSVILGALSVGYFVGGIIADKLPNPKRFYLIIIASGIACLFIQLFSSLILRDIGYAMGIKWGPLIISLIMFSIPSFLLVMLSPFAIKLVSDNIHTTGRNAGMVFFLSTIGSIFGSLITGFFLIPNFGISMIIVTTSFILFFIGAGGLFAYKDNDYPLKNWRLVIAFLIGILLCMVIVTLLMAQLINKNSNTIYEKDGMYGRIKIINQPINNQLATALYIDRTCEGAIYPNTNELPILYANYYSLYKLINPEIKTALFLGGGLYAMPRALLIENQTIKNVDVIEIDPDLYSLAGKYFNLVNDKRLTNYIGDGRRYLVETDKQYGMIFADVYYSLYSIPVHFTTKEFFQLARARLTNDGFILMNVIGSLDENRNQFLLSEFKTFQSVFKNSYIIAVDSPEKKEIQNFIFVGIKNDDHYLNFYSGQKELPLISDIINKVVNKSNLPLEKAIIFTDNFSPIEKLTANIF